MGTASDQRSGGENTLDFSGMESFFEFSTRITAWSPSFRHQCPVILIPSQETSRFIVSQTNFSISRSPSTIHAV